MKVTIKIDVTRETLLPTFKEMERYGVTAVTGSLCGSGAGNGPELTVTFESGGNDKTWEDVERFLFEWHEADEGTVEAVMGNATES